MKNEKIKHLREEAEVLYLLGTLIDSGVPILETIKLVAQTSARYQEALMGVHDDLRSGDDMSTPLRKYPHLFSPSSVALIEVGENTGELNKTTVRASELLSKIAKKVESGEEIIEAKMSALVDYYLLSYLIYSGLPLLRCLEILQETSNSPLATGGVWKIVRDQMKGGSCLSEAMASLPDSFSASVCAIVRAGEAGGVLDVVFSQCLVPHFERQVFET